MELLSVDIEKYFYSGYGIRFDSRSFFSIPNFDGGENAVIVRVENSSSVLIDNKKKDILALNKTPSKDWMTLR